MTATAHPTVWVLDTHVADATLERLGDARTIANRIACAVCVLIVTSDSFDSNLLIQHGADAVCHAIPSTIDAGTASCVAAAQRVFSQTHPRVIFAPGDPRGREWAALLAAASGYKLISPTLMVEARSGSLEVTTLNPITGLARRVRLAATDTAVVTLRPGVGEALPADASRHGHFSTIRLDPVPEAVQTERLIPADPATVDIRFAARLISGGRGLGSKRGFDLLRRFASKINAGVAASRMAVDLGWIEHERQVGQTGKTVTPDLYIACGISGASHHLEGMAAAKHIIAINTDSDAPIFKAAHLGLVADLYKTLEEVEKSLPS